MKLLHLADLHLGRKLGHWSLVEDQRYILKEIVAIAQTKEVDGVILAGDIYDKAVPSEEAVGLFEDFLVDLVSLPKKPQIFAIYGNHDGGKRLSFLHALTGRLGIHFSPVYEGAVSPLTLEDEQGAVDFYLLPFVSPLQLRRYFEGVNSYEEGLTLAIEAMNVDKSRRNVLITHQYIHREGKAEESESEEHHFVGGTAGLSYEVVKDFDYVALGHLHQAQYVGRPWIRYSGSPLKYSAKERNKSVTVVELGEKGSEIGVETLDLRPLRELSVLRGTLEEILTMEGDYVIGILEDEEPVLDDLQQLQGKFPYLVSFHYDNPRSKAEMQMPSLSSLEGRSPLEIFQELYTQQMKLGATKKRGKKKQEEQEDILFSQEQNDYLEGLIQEIWEGKS